MDEKLYFTLVAVVLLLSGIFVILASLRLKDEGWKPTIGWAFSAILLSFGSVILATFDWTKPEAWQDTSYRWYERTRESVGYPVEKFPCYTEVPSTEVTQVVLAVGIAIGLAFILLSEWRRTWLISNTVVKFDLLHVVYTLIGVALFSASVFGMNYQEVVKKEIWEIQETVLDITDSPKRRSCLLQRRREQALKKEEASWKEWSPENWWPKNWSF